MKRLDLWLLDRNYFSDLMKTLSTFGNLDLCVAVAKLPPRAHGEAHVTGWVPRSSQRKLIERVKKSTEGHCEISFADPDPEEEIPSLINHHRFLRPFEKLVLSFGIPSYNELDPTWFMAFSFMLVFSFMFADVGHGLVLATVGLATFVLGRKADQVGGVLSYVLQSGGLLIVCGLSGVMGGVLLGEFFGYHVSFLASKIVLPEPLRIVLPFRPIEEPMQMFKLSLLVGTLHISFGLVLNIVNRLLQRRFRAAFFEGGCWLWFYVGLMYSIFSYGLNLFALAASPIMLWGIVMPLLLMLLGRLSIEGIDGFVFFTEAVISSVSNTISYLRILALSLAHSIISLIILEVGGHNLLVAVGGCLPALALEGLIVFIHSTRLMWVEWFSKFYKGGGTLFKAKVVFDWEILGIQSPILETIQVAGKQPTALGQL